MHLKSEKYIKDNALDLFRKLFYIDKPSWQKYPLYFYGPSWSILPSFDFKCLQAWGVKTVILKKEKKERKSTFVQIIAK